MRTIMADTAFENCDDCEMFEFQSNEWYEEAISKSVCLCAHKQICLNAIKIYEKGKAMLDGCPERRPDGGNAR